MPVLNGGNPYNGYIPQNLGLAQPYQYGQYVYPQQARQQNMQQPQNIPQPSDKIYVHGIEGAYAHPLPPGVMKLDLWDDTENCFYVKGYDENGIPRILQWCDYFPHKVEEKSEAASIDLSNYPTKDDMKEMLGNIDLSNYMTKEDFTKAINSLTIGANGRIVMNQNG